MTGGVDKTFCILGGGKRIVTGRGPGAAADDDSSKRSSY